MADLTKRLVRAMRVGDLTVADLAAWFQIPYPTMRSWALLDRTPRRGSPRAKLAERRMRLLELAIGKGLPAPQTLSAQERPRYIGRVRDGFERSRVPAGDPA